MNFQKVYIEKLISIDPPEYLSSSEIEKMLAPLYERLKLPEGRLELMTGIRRRGYWPRSVKPSDISAEAGEKIVDDEVDLLIHCSVCRDQLEPSTSSSVHQKLGLAPEVMSFDISNACLGVMSALRVAAGLIEAGQIRKALLVSGENSANLLLDTISHLQKNTSITRKEIKDYIASLTIGSAGIGVLVGGNASDALFQVEKVSSLSDTSAVDLCKGGESSGKTLMMTSSEELLHKGIALGKKNWERFYEGKEFQKVITHQVGKSHQALILSSLGFEESQDYPIYQDFGNSGSAAIFSALHKAREAHHFKEGDRIALLGIGSGLHATTIGLKCLKA